MAETGDRHDTGSGEYAFTNFQWYLANSLNTVFFGAFTRTAMTPAAFEGVVRQLLALAPQLNWQQDVARGLHRDTRPFPIGAVASFETVASLSGFPGRAVAARTEIFDDPALPAFRAFCYALDRPDEAGRCAFILLQSSHALMEGADSSSFVRGLPALHEAPGEFHAPPFFGRIAARLAAPLLGPFHLAMARFHRKDTRDFGFAFASVDRVQFREVARDLGVRQRSLLFAMILAGLFHEDADAPARAKLIGFSSLSARRFAGDDPYMKLRVHAAYVKPAPTFAAYVRALDRQLGGESADSMGAQLLYNRILGFHRGLSRLIPGAYDRKFFTYVPYDFVLSLLPSHRPNGSFAGIRSDEIFCGSCTPGVNSCVIVPHLAGIGLGFYAETAIRDRLDRLAAFAEGIGIACRLWPQA